MPAIYHFDQPPAIVVGACGHGLALIRALHEGQVPVLALETNFALPGVHTRLAQIEKVDEINGPALIETLLNLRPRLRCPGKPVLFLTNDSMVRTLSIHGAALDPHYLLSWSNCRDKVAALLYKPDLETFCQKQGLLYPPTHLLHSSSDVEPAMAATGPSAIIKPARPLSGFKTAFPRQRGDFEQLIERFEADLPFLAQKFIPGDDSCIFFCALFLDRGEVLARFLGRKLRSRPLGHTTIAQCCMQDDVYRETLRFFAGLNLSGPASLELKRDAEGQLWVMEPTIGRTDFWLGLCTANQVNLPLTEYRSQLSITEKQPTQSDCAVWFNEERDPLGRLWMALHPEFGLARRHSSYLYLHGDDRAPAVAYGKLALSHLIAKIFRKLKHLVRIGTAEKTPARDATPAKPADDSQEYTVTGYQHPREFPAALVDLFVKAADKDFESSPFWYANFVDTVLDTPNAARFHILWRQQCPIAALPVMITREPLHSELRSLGNYYTALYSPLLSQEGDTRDLQKLLAAVEKDHRSAHVMRFSPMDPESPTYHGLLGALRANNWITFQFFCFGNWFLRVDGTWSDYLKKRSANLRSSLKRRCKRFAAEGGTLEVVTTIGDSEQGIAAFQEVYSASWKIPEPYPEFVPSLIRQLAAAGMLRLGIARLQGRTIAAQLWIVDKQKASIYKVAYHGDFASYSPGTVLTAHLLQHVIDRDHVDEVDFLIGDDKYKRMWMSDRRERWGIVAYNPATIIGFALLTVEVVGRTIKTVTSAIRLALSPTGSIGRTVAAGKKALTRVVGRHRA